MSNWYTSELVMNLYDTESRRFAMVELAIHKDVKYRLTLKTEPRILEKNDVITIPFYSLERAKAAGKAWVELGIKPKEASHE